MHFVLLFPSISRARTHAQPHKAPCLAVRKKEKEADIFSKQIPPDLCTYTYSDAPKMWSIIDYLGLTDSFQNS